MKRCVEKYPIIMETMHLSAKYLVNLLIAVCSSAVMIADI